METTKEANERIPTLEELREKTKSLMDVVGKLKLNTDSDSR